MTLLAALSIASEALVVLVGVLRWTRIGRPLKILTALFGVMTVLELMLYVLIFRLELNPPPFWIYHLVTLTQFLGFTLILADWERQPVMKRVMMGSLAVYLVIWIAFKGTIEPFTDYDRPSIILAIMVLVLFASWSLWDEWLNHLTDLFQRPRFWVCVGVLTYFVGGFFYLAYLSEWVKIPEALLPYYLGFNNSLTLLTSLIFVRSLLCRETA